MEADSGWLRLQKNLSLFRFFLSSLNVRYVGILPIIFWFYWVFTDKNPFLCVQLKGITFESERGDVSLTGGKICDITQKILCTFILEKNLSKDTFSKFKFDFKKNTTICLLYYLFFHLFLSIYNNREPQKQCLFIATRPKRCRSAMLDPKGRSFCCVSGSLEV